MPRVGAVIPARGGSKGIAGKNLVRVGGVPLVVRAVRACVQAASIDDVVVSTDDGEIARVAGDHGAIVVTRPAALAGDAASSESAVIHVLEHLATPWTTALLVQCTSPFTQPRDLDALVEMVTRRHYDSAFTGTPTHRFRWDDLPDGSLVAHGHDPTRRLPRQALAHQFEETGAAYAFTVGGFIEHQSRFFGRTGVVSIPQIRGLEIDEPDDLTIARALVAVVEPAQVMTLIRPPRAVVFDFDGVMTDNLVSVDDRGREAVSVSRADGLAVGQLRGMVELLVLSTETSPVVERRCEKLHLPCRTGIDVKLPVLQAWLAEVEVDPLDCVYVGNDRNDLACMEFVGTAIAPADAESEALDVADVVLTRSGGKGAVREVVGLVLAALMER